MTTANTNTTDGKAGAYAWYALGLLTIIYMMNFIDRVLIYILFTPIKKELIFSDLQLALLGSTSFVIFYTLLGIPFGKLSDKMSRKKLIAIGLTVWSLFSGLTGFANEFWTIFICRMMVGVGEATLGPAALSLLSDYFPAKMRATVQAVFSSAIAIGTGVAFFFGGWIGAELGWRFAFYFLGFPGILFAILVLMLKEPERGIRDTVKAKVKLDWRGLLKVKQFKYLLLGYAFFGIASNSVSIWVPTFLVRTHTLNIAQIGAWVGIATVIGGLPGTVAGGVIADKLRLKRKGGRLLFSSIAALLCIPVWGALLFIDAVSIQIFCTGLLLAFALSWLGPAAADINDIAGPHLRGLAVGVYFFVVNVIGYGIAPPLYGKVNDLLGIMAQPYLMKFTLILSPVACIICAALLYKAAKIMEKEND
jgi:MFS family permease